MPIQNHIHLYRIGEAVNQWGILKLQITPTVYTNVQMTLTGRVHASRLTDAVSGNPVITEEIDMVIIVRDEPALVKTWEQRLAEIEAMYGQWVHYVPLDHTETPLDPIYTAFLQPGSYEPFNVAIRRFDIPIKLTKGIMA